VTTVTISEEHISGNSDIPKNSANFAAEFNKSEMELFFMHNPNEFK